MGLHSGTDSPMSQNVALFEEEWDFSYQNLASTKETSIDWWLNDHLRLMRPYQFRK